VVRTPAFQAGDRGFESPRPYFFALPQAATTHGWGLHLGAIRVTNPVMDEKRIKNVPLFRDLGKAERRRIAQAADEVDVPEGYELLHEGDFAHEFMVIEEGRAEVRRDDERVAELGPGDFLGEIAALEHGQRNATVVAITPITMIVMTDGDLRAIARDMPAVDAVLREALQARKPQR
jgi:CRP/FNR family transcriptional regulator, cyclic AMP receptor protein